MSMELWDPYAQTMSLRDAMDRLLQDSFFRPTRGNAGRGGEGNLLPLDVSESDDAYTIQASLPGIKPEDVQIQLVGDTVTIRGQAKEEREERRGDHVVMRERRMGSFARALTLPMPVDTEHAEATFENGELTLRLPKSQQARARRIEVRSANGQQGQRDGQVNIQHSTAGQQIGQSQAANRGTGAQRQTQQ
jgi:HSP20 family protein